MSADIVKFKVNINTLSTQDVNINSRYTSTLDINKGTALSLKMSATARFDLSIVTSHEIGLEL